jgi:hypothetical protein
LSWGEGLAGEQVEERVAGKPAVGLVEVRAEVVVPENIEAIS